MTLLSLPDLKRTTHPSPDLLGASPAASQTWISTPTFLGNPTGHQPCTPTLSPNWASFGLSSSWKMGWCEHSIKLKGFQGLPENLPCHLSCFLWPRKPSLSLSLPPASQSSATSTEGKHLGKSKLPLMCLSFQMLGEYPGFHESI